MHARLPSRSELEENKMKENKLFWTMNMAGCIIIWGLIFWGMFITDLKGPLRILWWIFTLLFCGLHPLELKISLPIAKRFGLPVFKTIIMTLLFGITWWYPLKRGVFETKSTRTEKIIVISGSIILIFAMAVFLTLPSILSILGIHPHYEGQKFDLKGKKALIIATNIDTLGETGKATGVYGSEITIPYYRFLDNGMQVDVASIKGANIPFEPSSLKWPLVTDADKRYLADTLFLDKTRNSLKIDGINFTTYDIIFMAGGWGAAYDLGFSAVLGEKITQAHAAGVIIGGVCHGPLGLLKAKEKNGAPLVKGKKITAVTNKQVKELGIDMTPLHPEEELRRLGAKFESKTSLQDMFANHVVIDGNLVTGQNQNSGAETAHKMMVVLQKDNRK
jgi:putative intracellular protease/amidase